MDLQDFKPNLHHQKCEISVYTRVYTLNNNTFDLKNKYVYIYVLSFKQNV